MSPAVSPNVLHLSFRLTLQTLHADFVRNAIPEDDNRAVSSSWGTSAFRLRSKPWHRRSGDPPTGLLYSKDSDMNCF